MKQETADKIVCQLKNQQEKDRNFIYSLVNEQEYVRGRGVGVKAEDEPICPWCKETIIPNSCGTVGKYQHYHSSCWKEKQRCVETDEEISLRMFEDWEHYRDKTISENPHTRIYLDFPDWLRSK